MSSTIGYRTRWIVIVVVAGALIAGCVGLGIGFVVGNIVGENAVCDEVFDHVDNPQDVPTCRDPWW